MPQTCRHRTLELIAVAAAQLLLRFRQVAACRRIGDKTIALLVLKSFIFARRCSELSTAWDCRQHFAALTLYTNMANATYDCQTNLLTYEGRVQHQEPAKRQSRFKLA